MTLSLTRRPEEAIIVKVPASTTPIDIRVSVAYVRGKQVTIGIDAPYSVKLLRAELVNK